MSLRPVGPHFGESSIMTLNMLSIYLHTYIHIATNTYIHVHWLLCKIDYSPNWNFKNALELPQKKLFKFSSPSSLRLDLFIYILNIFVCLTFLPNHGQSTEWSIYFFLSGHGPTHRANNFTFISNYDNVSQVIGSRSLTARPSVYCVYL